MTFRTARRTEILAEGNWDRIAERHHAILVRRDRPRLRRAPHVSAEQDVSVRASRSRHALSRCRCRCCCWKRGRRTTIGRSTCRPRASSSSSTSRFNWSYVSEPEPYLDNRRLTHPRGRVLGGSSSINGMALSAVMRAITITGRNRGCAGWRPAPSCCPISNAPRAIRRAATPITAGVRGLFSVARPDLA